LPGSGTDASANGDGSPDATVLDGGAAPDGSDATAAHGDSGVAADAGGEASAGDAGGLGHAGPCVDSGYMYPMGCAVVLASAQNTPRDIAVDAVNVYWCNSGTPGATDGTIMKVPIGGGTPVTLASGQDNPEFLTIDATTVYWSNLGPGGAGEVMRVPIAGGTPVTLGASTFPQDLVVDATYVYWADQKDGEIYRAPIAGGTQVTFAAAPSAVGVAIDAARIYWTEVNAAGAVMSKPLDGGAAKTIATGQGSPWEVVVDATYAYWRDLDIGGTRFGIAMAPLAGGTPTFIGSLNGSGNLALDAKTLYMGTPSSVLGFAVPLTIPDGGAVPYTDFANGQQNPSGLAVDSTSLYWADLGGFGDGTIMKLTPK
jgi:hypothetical protein